MDRKRKWGQIRGILRRFRLRESKKVTYEQEAKMRGRFAGSGARGDCFSVGGAAPRDYRRDLKIIYMDFNIRFFI